MRTKVTIFERPVSLENLSIERLESPERCLVCDCQIPTGCHAARTADDDPICCSSCLAQLQGVLDKPIDSIEREASDLEEEAENMRDEASYLEQDAEQLRKKADSLRANQSTRLAAWRLARPPAKGS